MSSVINRIVAGEQAFARETVEALVQSRAEPEWLRQRRLEAWEIFSRLPMPGRPENRFLLDPATAEEWRRTDFSALELSRLTPVREPLARVTDFQELDAPVRDGLAIDELSGALVQQENSPVFRTLRAELERKGVLFIDLDTALREYPELLREHFMSVVPASSGKFAAMHGAFWTGGVLLHVPQDVEIELPLQARTWLSEPGLAIFTHTLIICERNSRVTFIDEYLSPRGQPAGQSLNSGIVEVVLRDGAQLRYVNLQEWGPSVFNVVTIRTKLGRDTLLNSLVLAFGSRASKAKVESFLEGPGSKAEMLGVFFGSDHQLIDHHTLQEHIAPHATSDLLYKGALKDYARSVYNGMIRVHAGAQRTDAYQANRNLLLSDHARADSIPNLEIGANDVRCTHGATVGPVDPEQLFYLMSRGLPRVEATRLIVDGFFGEILQRIPLQSILERLQAAIDVKMHGEG